MRSRNSGCGWFSVALILCLLLANAAKADPWIETDDALLRVSLQQLADAGYLSDSLTTYPLLWYGIARDLRGLDLRKLTPSERFAYDKVSAALDFSRRANTVTTRVDVVSDSSDSRLRTNTFGDSYHAEGNLANSYTRVGEHVAIRIRTNLRTGAKSDKRLSFDGSYVALTRGNWALSLDQVANWWGPANENALVLSNNSLGIQAVRATRLSQQPLKFAPFLGSVGATGFVGRTQSATSYGDRQVGGARVSLRPVTPLTMGLSGVTHWSSLSEQYNQVTGVDIRLGLASGAAVYGEVARSDMHLAGNAWTLGAEHRFALGAALHQLVLEHSRIPDYFYADTSEYVGAIELDGRWVAAVDGYRRWGQSMGASQDQDVRVTTVSHSLQTREGWGVQMRLRYGDYGPGNAKIFKPRFFGSGNQLNEMGRVHATQLSILAQVPVADQLIRFGISRYWVNTPSTFQNSLLISENTELSLGWEYRY